MTRAFVPGAALLVAAALSACGGDATPTPDTITARQRDSMIGQSSIPGAGGVAGALGASDTMAARNRQLDSIGAEP